MNLDRPARADRIHFLMGFPLDVDLIRGALQQPGDVGDHLRLSETDLGTLANHGDIRITHPIPRLLDSSVRLDKEAR